MFISVFTLSALLQEGVTNWKTHFYDYFNDISGSMFFISWKKPTFGFVACNTIWYLPSSGGGGGGGGGGSCGSDSGNDSGGGSSNKS